MHSDFSILVSSCYTPFLIHGDLDTLKHAQYSCRIIYFSMDNVTRLLYFRRQRDTDKHKFQVGDITTSGSPTSTVVPNQLLRILNEEEDYQIGEVISAYRQSLEIVVESDVSRDRASFTDLVNIAEISVRRVIDMAKKIKSFKALSQKDQITLLKGGSIELLIIRSVINYDTEKQQFLDPYDTESAAMTEEQFQIAASGLFDDHMKFVRSLANDMRADETVLILLLVVSLFSPDRPGLEDKDYVLQEQDKYALLLCHYLESKHAPHLAKQFYPRLLMKLTDIRNLNEEHSQVLLKVNPDGIQPLMKEVLDMNLPTSP